jgi:hypothetical protein
MGCGGRVGCGEFEIIGWGDWIPTVLDPLQLTTTKQIKSKNESINFLEYIVEILNHSLFVLTK